MNAVGDTLGYRVAVAGLTLIACIGGAAGCGSGSSGSDASTTKTSSSTTDPRGGGSSTTAEASTTATSAEGTTSTTTAARSGFSEKQHTAPADGTGTALLRAVRVGRNAGFERIVFEFAGSSVPGYRVQWVDGPITADGSGEPVDVTGEAFLEIVMEPASGVDLSAPQLTIVYDGPDRVPVSGQTALITDLVRTGDFEAVLSWAAGTTEQVPFRVLRLEDPVRVVVDLEAP